jgi:hypothetical protein
MSARASWRCAAVLTALASAAACSGDSASHRGAGEAVVMPDTGSGGQSGSGGQPGSGGSGSDHTGSGGVHAPSMDAATAQADAGLPAPNIDALLDKNCARSTMQSALLPSNLLFVIDRSSSMACNPPPTTDSATCESNPVAVDPTAPTKWSITRTALSHAIAALPDDTVVGLTYFSNDDACGVDSLPSVPLAALAPGQRSAIEASLANVLPNGATPLVGATILAYAHLHQLAIDGTLHGSEFVVLLTDGQQSEPCSDPPRCSGQAECTQLLINEEVPKAAGPGVGIKTFVIGAPGSEPARSVLSAIAENGGTAPAGCDVDAGTCHFDMTKQTKFDQALADALSQIAGRALSCVLPVPRLRGMTIDPQLVNVVYSPADGSAPKLIFKDDRAPCDSGADGWQYTDDMRKIRLCGPTCDRVRADRGARVDVVLGCPVRAPE